MSTQSGAVHYPARRGLVPEYNTRQARWSGEVITPALITYVQRWLGKYGLSASLVIERVGDRNRVALRLLRDSCIYEGEVAALNALRKREPTAPAERVLLLFVKLD